MLSLLHPTPAVCGYPQAAARDMICSQECFDRGFYSGPIGWIGGSGCEFVVGIRSALIPKPDTENQNGTQKPGHKILLYAGVGVVRGTKADSEWQELNLKTSQFESIMAGSPAVHQLPNINMVWATLLVEECCRNGVNYFCIAPGSRSSPLAVAAAMNPRVESVVCYDERSLAFHALGYARGSGKPAVVITSSGTAVANLLPAVVEAYQDNVPMVLLTADRPHELRDTGANQTIDQVSIFGSYVRHETDLPCPDPTLPARLVLTTIDSAIHNARNSPRGPVHINCPFREPLAPTVDSWTHASCLASLDNWLQSSAPYTAYWSPSGELPPQRHPPSPFLSQIQGLLRSARRGLLVVGGLHSREETWAAWQLTRALGWPVFADVLSGLRLNGLGNGRVAYFLDQALLDPETSAAMAPDVVLQVGGRVTSKRVAALIDSLSVSSHILLEEHPYRQDPSHRVTHRIQMTLPDFVSAILESQPSPATRQSAAQASYRDALLAISEVVDARLAKHFEECEWLTEPWVARTVVRCLEAGEALFLGNSMAIRDTDMYASVRDDSCHGSEVEGGMGCEPMVAANRGASGIDGVLSTAVGFSAGSKRPVTVLLGDLSFLHDTNGLSLLETRPSQPPVTVVVVNNNGGGIFSLLPIASCLPQQTFTSLFSTPQDVQIQDLCKAHGIPYVHVSSKSQLLLALRQAKKAKVHWVVEVASSIAENTTVHKELQTLVKAVVSGMAASKQESEGSRGSDRSSIQNIRYSMFKMQLEAPTTAAMETSPSLHKRGIILQVELQNGAVGYGEISPLPGLHKESMEEAELQLILAAAYLHGQTVAHNLLFLRGNVESLLQECLPFKVSDLLPSVRFGIESAILTSLSASAGRSLSSLLLASCTPWQPCLPSHTPQSGSLSAIQQPLNPTAMSALSPHIFTAALVDSVESIAVAVDQSIRLVEMGFRTLKIKVGRRKVPEEDADVVRSVREAVGPSVRLRVDANRKWSLAEAMDFGRRVSGVGIEFIEEPVDDPKDLRTFFEATGLPFALDESLDEGLVGPAVSNDCHLQLGEGFVGVVIKPAVTGGLESTLEIIQWALRMHLKPIISSSFESSVGLAVLCQLACLTDALSSTLPSQNENGVSPEQNPKTDHGLGTFRWIREDSVTRSQGFQAGGPVVQNCRKTGRALISMAAVESLLQSPELAASIVPISRPDCRYEHVKTAMADYRLCVYHSGSHGSFPAAAEDMAVVFLHGFMGSSEDWFPIMQSLQTRCRCLAIDLPGQGKSTARCVPGSGSLPSQHFEMDQMSNVIISVIRKSGARKVFVVGYSMGARLALDLCLKNQDLVCGAVLISGSPGIRDDDARLARLNQDLAMADSLRSGSPEDIVQSWYLKPLWKSLREHRIFGATCQRRIAVLRDDDARLSTADVLEGLSTGRQRSLWGDLPECQTPLLLVVGSLDAKFCQVAKEMEAAYGNGSASERAGGRKCSVAEIKDCGHAVHLEEPFKCLAAIAAFFAQVRRQNNL